MLLLQAGKYPPLLERGWRGTEAADPAIALLVGEARVGVDEARARRLQIYIRQFGGRVRQGSKGRDNPAGHVTDTMPRPGLSDEMGDPLRWAAGKASDDVCANPDCAEQLNCFSTVCGL